MPTTMQHSRVDILELKYQIQKKLGCRKAETYFDLLTRFISLKIGKDEFHKLCIGMVGKENVYLHNIFLQSILKNACLSKTPPSRLSKAAGTLSIKVENGYQKGSPQSLCREFAQSSSQMGITPSFRDRKFKDRISPLGPHGKSNQEQQSATELFSMGSRPPCSVEDGEEVEQASESPSIYSRSPVRAPLGIPQNAKRAPKILLGGSTSTSYSETCQNNSELPDTSSLMKRLQQKLVMEGMKVSMDYTDLLNNGLDLYLKRLIKPCLELSASRSRYRQINQGNNPTISALNGMWPVRHLQNPSRSKFASIIDFQVATELNPRILGEEWPTKLEKISLHASEEIMEADRTCFSWTSYAPVHKSWKFLDQGNYIVYMVSEADYTWDRNGIYHGMESNRNMDIGI